MIPKRMCFVVGVVIVVVGAWSCAGVRQYSIGIPAHTASSFFPQMKSVAQQRNMTVAEHPDSLNVKTKNGDWLQYMIRQTEIQLVLVPNVDGLNEQQIAQKQASLKKLSDELVEDARKQAEKNKAFEPGI